MAGEAPGGGSYGGNGGRPELNGGTDSAGTHAISGQTYCTLNLEALLAGSGGGGGSVEPGGSGAGAIKITAGGKLTIGKSIFANGGNGIADSTNDAAKSGAGGSGGSIYLKANELEISSNTLISANGGTGAPSTTTGGTITPLMEAAPDLQLVGWQDIPRGNILFRKPWQCNQCQYHCQWGNQSGKLGHTKKWSGWHRAYRTPASKLAQFHQWYPNH